MRICNYCGRAWGSPTTEDEYIICCNCQEKPVVCGYCGTELIPHSRLPSIKACPNECWKKPDYPIEMQIKTVTTQTLPALDKIVAGLIRFIESKFGDEWRDYIED